MSYRSPGQMFISIAEARDQVRQLRGEIEETTQSLPELISQLETVERTLVKALSLVRMASGSEDLRRFIGLTQSAINVVNQLQLSATLLMSTNPWLWPLGIMGAVGTAASFANQAGSYV